MISPCYHCENLKKDKEECSEHCENLFNYQYINKLRPDSVDEVDQIYIDFPSTGPSLFTWSQCKRIGNEGLIFEFLNCTFLFELPYIKEGDTPEHVSVNLNTDRMLVKNKHSSACFYSINTDFLRKQMKSQIKQIKEKENHYA